MKYLHYFWKELLTDVKGRGQMNKLLFLNFFWDYNLIVTFLPSRFSLQTLLYTHLHSFFPNCYYMHCVYVYA